MQALLEHFILQSAMYALIAVALVAFLESLALGGHLRGSAHFLRRGYSV